MEERIGQTAGKIWKHLEKNGEASSLKLKTALLIPNSLLYMAVGWLAREGKIQTDENERGYTFSIKK